MAEDELDILSGLRTALDRVHSFVYIKDTKQRYVYANQHTLDMFGTTADEVHHATDADFFPSDMVKKLTQVDHRVLAGESTTEEIVLDVGGAKKRVFHEVKTPIYSERDPDLVIGILGISTDITYQKSLEEQARKLAITDALTGVYNRLQLDRVLRGEFDRVGRTRQPLSVIMCDIDDFKQVNDTHGHLVGDECLKKVAAILKDNVRAVDTLGRWGGEEFLIICPDTDAHGTQVLAEKLRLLIAEACDLNASPITASFGVATHADGDTPDALVNRVDQALYNAKERGKNCVETIA